MTKQFDDRYRIAPRRGIDKAAQRRMRFVIENQEQSQASSSPRPTNIAWFEARLRDTDPPGDKPCVGYFCNMVPQELIAALGARPVRLGCGNPALVAPGEEVFSGEICSLAKSSFARFLDASSLASSCAALVVPTSCDAKKKLAEVLCDFAPTFALNLPPEKDSDRYGGRCAAELGRMTKFLCRVLGTKLRRKALLEQIALGQQRTSIVRELLTARAQKLSALSIRDLFIIIQASFTGVALDEWNRQASVVLEEVHAHQPARKRMRPRMILTGAPIIWPNFKLLNLIEECGADVVADTLCTGGQSCFDAVVVDETSTSALQRALSCRYIFASVCPCFISQGTRISRVLELVDEYRADGVINFSLRLCQLFDMETYRLSNIMKSRKIPFTTIRTDYSLEDIEQLRVRLEAFLETVWEEL